MGTLSSNNLFQSWDLSEQEVKEGTVLYTLQKQVIQNRMAMAAAERVLLPFSPENIQRDAELQGEIRTLRWLLDESARQELENSLTQQKQEAQEQGNENMSNLLFKSVLPPGYKRPDSQ
jgi:hypothetical protein